MNIMKTKRMKLTGIAFLLALMMFGTFIISAVADDPTTIIVKPSEGVTFSDVGDGTEPPPHVIVYDKDGNLRVGDPARNH
jgi:hypothetical protein